MQSDLTNMNINFDNSVTHIIFWLSGLSIFVTIKEIEPLYKTGGK